MINKKALTVFLVATFSLTILLLVLAKIYGLSLVGTPPFLAQMIIAVAMFVPGLCAIFTQKFVLKRPLRELGFAWSPWRMYVKTYAVIILLFTINYAFTWLFLLKPDFTLASFINQFSSIRPGMALPVPAQNLIAIFTATTLIAAPIFNLIPSMGEEVGWRGFLLPALEPLGKIKAAVISSMIWALWHTPMILLLGFLYGRQAWPGVILHFVLVTGLGIFIAHLWFETRSTVLAGFIHSVFNANAYGIWSMLFISNNKLLIGAGGVVGSLLCLALGVATLATMQRNTLVAANNCTNQDR